MSETPPEKERREENKKRSGPALNIALFLLTLLTVFCAGSGIQMLIADTMLIKYTMLTGKSVPPSAWMDSATNGLSYMATLMGILLAHEFGHYTMARLNRVDASLPYFIPAPYPMLLGTFGAVIMMRGRIKSRNALMEVGAAGPLAGMIVAVPALFLGLSLSPVEPIPAQGLMEGQSILYMFIKWVVVGSIPEGHDVILHPIAWAGWVGLLVTMLNLFPIGQLDGGHIFYALFGDIHARVSRLFHRSLFGLGFCVMGYEAWNAVNRGMIGENVFLSSLPGMQWIFLGGLLALFHRKRGFKHPPTDDDTLSPTHRGIGILCIVVFVLIFMPVVLRPII